MKPSIAMRPGNELLRVSCSEDGLALGDAVRSALADHWSVADLDRAQAELTVADEAWGHLERIGLPAAIAPTESGGGDADVTVLATAVEEVGFAALPAPVVETVVVLPLMLRAGLLPEDSPNRGRVTVAHSMDAPMFFLRSCPVVNIGADGLVEWFQGVDATPRPGIDPLFSLSALSATTGSVLWRRQDHRLAATVRAGVLWGYASYLNGISMYLISRTLSHAKERIQFGRPLFGFQSVRHQLASALVDLVMARAAAHGAARHHAEEERDFGTEAVHSAVMAQQASRRANHLALQLHGALGFSWESGIHWWLKRGKAIEGWLDRWLADAMTGALEPGGG